MTIILDGLLKTHNCGELRKKDVLKEVSLCGWVNKYRNLGGLHFVDVRDKFGITQLSFEEFQKNGGNIDCLKDCSLESVIKAQGLVKERPAAAINKEMETGEIEISVTSIELLSKSNIDTIPFLPFGATDAGEDLKLKYRYLDLRTNKLQKMIALRSKVMQVVRNSLVEEGFIEVETPILYKSTPEGARDYIVPSRIHKGKVYALPQSPQTLKQLLMIGGTDKYFQICRCFRDEDLRADRQPEFSQIDIEVSFATANYIKKLVEKLVTKIFKLDSIEIPVMSYQTAMNDYGCDKPDLRFGLKQMIVTDLFTNSSFATFSTVAKDGGIIKALFVPETLGVLSRKQIDSFVSVVKPYGGKGVAWFKVTEKNFSGGISKFINDEIYQKLIELSEDKGDGIWLFSADNNHQIAHASADAVRRFLGKELGLIEDVYKFIWINEFPLLEWSEEDNRFAARHHPFTMPSKESMVDFMNGDQNALKNCTADAYDLVCNGYEIAGGSLRIFKDEVQSKMFNVLGMSDEEARYQFGFFIDALKYGTPPHAGIAFGLDRLMMLVGKTENIKDVIAFPKTTSANDLMAGSPSMPSDAQIKELHFTWSE